MLEVANLEVVYNDVVLVLRGLSLEVRDGQIVALLGANGAGKTTTLRAVTGLLDVHDGDITKGSVTYNDQEIHHKDASQIVRSGIAQVMEGRRVFAEMSVEDNLRTGATTNKDSTNVKESHDRVMEMFPLLAERKKDIAGYLSGGEQQSSGLPRCSSLRFGTPLLTSTDRARVSCSSSRTPTWHSRSPITGTSWRRARS